MTDSLKSVVTDRFDSTLAQTATKGFAADYSAMHSSAGFLKEDIADNEAGPYSSHYSVVGAEQESPSELSSSGSLSTDQLKRLEDTAAAGE